MTAAQTSRHGEGWVGLTQAVASADGLPCDLLVEFAAQPGGAWQPALLIAATAQVGSVTLSNATPPQVAGIACAEADTPITNLVSATWDTRSATPAIVLESNLLLRAAAWNGFFWSPPVTSQPFQVDNQPPDAAQAALHFPRSAAGDYWVGTAITGIWSGFSDAGSGLAAYHVADQEGGGVTQTLPIAQTHWVWNPPFSGRMTGFVWAADAVGNLSPAISQTVWMVAPDSDDDGDGGSGSTGVVIGGAVVLAAAAVGGALAVRRRAATPSASDEDHDPAE